MFIHAHVGTSSGAYELNHWRIKCNTRPMRVSLKTQELTFVSHKCSVACTWSITADTHRCCANNGSIIKIFHPWERQMTHSISISRFNSNTDFEGGLYKTCSILGSVKQVWSRKIFNPREG